MFFQLRVKKQAECRACHHRLRGRFLAGLLLFAAVTACAGEVKDEKKESLEPFAIGAFEKNLNAWIYDGGGEFKGAKGALALDAGEGKGAAGSAKLTGDFSKGGSYVALRRPTNLDAREVRFQAKTPGLKFLDMRLMDGTKQYFQYRLPLKDTDEWQLVKLSDFEKAAGSWGGAKDKKWHAPLREIWIMLSKGALAKDTTEGTLRVDDVEVVRSKVEWVSPRPLPEGVNIPHDSIFGFSGHMLHSSLFYGEERMGPYWQLEYTLPILMDGGFGCMRECLYQAFFSVDEKSKNDPEKLTKVQKHRANVERYLDMYSKAGIKVLLCPLFTKADRPDFTEYFEWLASLPLKHRCIAGFEMHNEPNLKHFWPWTVKDYAEACRAGGKILKAKNPELPVIVGSISHMWWTPGVKFLNQALELGAMESADGISVHPYRQGSGPEGGHMHCKPQDPEGLEKELQEFWAMVQKHNTSGKPLSLYLTEFGYSSGTGKGQLMPEQSEGIQSVQMQADYVSRMMLVLFDMKLRGIPIEGLYWYDLKCDGTTDHLEHNFGLVNYDTATVRPGFSAYSEIAKTFGNTTMWERLELQAASSEQPNVVKHFAWKNLATGTLAVAFWRLDQLQEKKGDFQTELRLAMPHGFDPASVVLHRLGEFKEQALKFENAEGKLAAKVDVRLGASLLLVRPQTVEVLSGNPAWRHALPAAFKEEQPRCAIAVSSAPGAAKDAVKLHFKIENSSDKKVAGSIVCQGVKQPFTLVGNETFECDIMPEVTPVEGSALVSYYVTLEHVLVARGDALIILKK